MTRQHAGRSAQSSFLIVLASLTGISSVNCERSVFWIDCVERGRLAHALAARAIACKCSYS